MSRREVRAVGQRVGAVSTYSFPAAQQLREHAALSLKVGEATLLDQLLRAYIGAEWIRPKRREAAREIRRKLKKLRWQ